MIGIIGALDEEIRLINDALIEHETVKKAVYSFHRGRLKSKDVVIVKCGVGKVNAALCTQILIDTFNCGKIIFGGVAGGLLPGLKQGDVVVSSHAIQFDVNLTAFGRRHGELADQSRLIEADPALVNIVADTFDDMAATMPSPPTFLVGTIVSGDSFVSDPETIKWLQREFGAACTEMEGGAVGYTCKSNEVPFVIIRIISDGAGEKATGEFDSFLSKSSEIICNLITETVNRI